MYDISLTVAQPLSRAGPRDQSLGVFTGPDTMTFVAPTAARIGETVAFICGLAQHHAGELG